MEKMKKGNGNCGLYEQLDNEEERLESIKQRDRAANVVQQVREIKDESSDRVKKLNRGIPAFFLAEENKRQEEERYRRDRFRENKK